MKALAAAGALLCTAVSLCLWAPATAAEPADSAPIAARVLWWRGDHVYAAALDSAAVAPGTRLTILDGRKRVATAEVSGFFDGEIIAARLTSGSLERVKRPERLRVLADPPLVPAVPFLRVGYLRAPHATIFYSCDRVQLSESWRSHYRVVDSTGAIYLLVRREGVSGFGVAGPDTLLARLFDDVPDMEIALERGDLDAAVFWPGEASVHIREAMRWDGALAGIRSRGAVTVSAGSDSAALDSMARSATLHSDLARLNREFFRGDLLLLDAPAPARDPTAGLPSAIWYEARGPYASAIERFLNHVVSSSTPRPGPGVLEIEYRDEPPGAEATPFRRSVFAVRCPIVTAPGFRAIIEAIGGDALVNLFDCVPDGRP